MIMSLQEIMNTCSDWKQFCKLHGFSEWAVNEGGGHIQVILTINQAHYLGIIKRIDSWKLEPFKKIYPGKEEL